ncbi:collagen alpha-1(XII) chain-like [Maylandia zebra]|uniref:collagen alpha-1(XII) chain-like n=1 Tax=Maylandia zebra TaxID=106582 RepID=UPI00403CDE69
MKSRLSLAVVAALMALLLSSSQAQEIDTQCNTTAKADIVLLLDGSWSIGQINFQTIRNFIAHMVSVFNIGPDSVQIGLTQYSNKPKTEWNLNAHPTKESLLRAVAALPYRGGNTLTGMALNYILKNSFKPKVGLRPDSHKIGVLITDGKSQDEVILASQNLRDSGIELYAIGVKNADENELRSIASDPDDIHIYNVKDFQFLVDIVDELSVNLCNSVKGSGSADGKRLRVSDETEKTMRVTWTPALGKLLNYRLKYVPHNGGKEVVQKIPAKATCTIMKNLKPATTYNITVLPIYKRSEGKAKQGVGTTLSPYKSPWNLLTSEPTRTSFRVSWDPAPGDVSGYKVTFHSRNNIDLKELFIGPDVNTIVVEKLSLKCAGDEKPTLTDEPKSPPLDPSVSADTQCKTTAKADIMLLVDGSWSIGRKNFKTIRNFIARLVSVFDIGPDRVQIGLAQYSGDPKTEWHLNTHHTKESLLNAVANLPYKGGNTMTGMALNHILQYNFKPNVGLRPDSHKISILITDGKSQDEVIVISQNLRDSGIELYAIGVKNADEYELRSIASDPDDIHMYNVYDFQFLVDITDELSVNLCNSVKGSEAPTNLVTSEVTQSSFRATWTPPNGTVEKYDVTYMMTAGERIEKLQVNGSVSTVVLENLNPLTEYVISVYAVVGKQSSEPLRGTETTRDG